MKSLLLLRHAIALPATSPAGDLERVLSPAGQEQARSVGAYLRARGWEPQQVLCSSAVRTRQTAEKVVETLGIEMPPVAIETLYSATVEDMFGVLRSQAAGIDRLLLVGHAPVVGELTSALCTRAADLSLNCEPATLMEIALNIDHWPDIKTHCGLLQLLLPA